MTGDRIDPTESGPMSEAAANEKKNVLIVEDEARMGQMLGQAMPELGFTARVVRTGEDALKAMADQPAPIVLLDLNLPGMNGLDTLRAIRDKWPDTQAIMLTGFGDLDAAKEAIHLDIVEFLTKPCHLGDLDTALSRAVRRIQKKEDAQRRDDAFHSEPAHVTADYDEDDGPMSLKDLERKAILESLARHDGNRQAVAEELQISVRTLYYRLDEYKKQGYL
jgi:DNA-binding NtrC family response regulator